MATTNTLEGLKPAGIMGVLADSLKNKDPNDPLFQMVQSTFTEWARSQKLQNDAAERRMATPSRNISENAERRMALRNMKETPAERAERISFHGGRTASGSWTNSYDVWKADRPTAEQRKKWNTNGSFRVEGGKAVPYAAPRVPNPIRDGTIVATNGYGAPVTAAEFVGDSTEKRVRRNKQGGYDFIFGKTSEAAAAQTRADRLVHEFNERQRARKAEMDSRIKDPYTLRDGALNYFQPYVGGPVVTTVPWSFGWLTNLFGGGRK